MIVKTRIKTKGKEGESWKKGQFWMMCTQSQINKYCLWILPAPKDILTQTKHWQLFLSNTGTPNSTYSRWQDLYSYPLGSFLKSRKNPPLCHVSKICTQSSYFNVCIVSVFLPWATRVKILKLPAGWILPVADRKHQASVGMWACHQF